LYRVITELINNSIKYSEATDISLKIFRRNNFLYVKYNDSGKGFDIENVLKRSKGMGLYNIQNRIRNIHGTIKFEKLKKIGFVAKIIVKIF
jgi:signal transduction histidine kinase